MRVQARLVTTLLAVAFALPLACGSITHEELVCEEAVSRLDDCCPDLDSRRLPCVQSSGDGCGGAADPVLTVRASQCILDSACEAMISRGSCDRIVSLSLVPHSIKDTKAIEQEACK